MDKGKQTRKATLPVISYHGSYLLSEHEIKHDLRVMHENARFHMKHAPKDLTKTPAATKPVEEMIEARGTTCESPHAAEYKEQIEEQHNDIVVYKVVPSSYELIIISDDSE